MQGAPSTAWLRELHTVRSENDPADSLTALLPVNDTGQPYSAMRLRQHNLCL